MRDCISEGRMSAQRPVKVIKAQDRFPQKKGAAGGDSCASMSLDDLRTLLCDARRRLNTLAETLDRADAIVKVLITE